MCVQAPVVVVSVWPTCGGPGNDRIIDEYRTDIDERRLVGALVAGALEPEPFVAVTETVSVFPTSAASAV